MLGRTSRILVMPLSLSLWRSLALSVAVLAGGAGCAASVASEPPASADSATRAPVAATAHGPVKLFGDALGDVPLTPPQRAQIEQLATAADARRAPVREARKELVLALASQVEAGQIDRTGLEPRLAALTTAMQGVQPADRAALEQLHAILGADQRVAFVDALRSRVGQRIGQAHHGALAQWATDLSLTPEQSAQLRTSIRQAMQAPAGGGDPHAGQGESGHAGHGDALLQAFTQDRFVAAEAAPPVDVVAQVGHGADRVLALAGAALPVLTPPQRAIAARKLREHADSPDEVGIGLP